MKERSLVLTSTTNGSVRDNHSSGIISCWAYPHRCKRLTIKICICCVNGWQRKLTQLNQFTNKQDFTTSTFRYFIERVKGRSLRFAEQFLSAYFEYERLPIEFSMLAFTSRVFLLIRAWDLLIKESGLLINTCGLLNKTCVLLNKTCDLLSKTCELMNKNCDVRLANQDVRLANQDLRFAEQCMLFADQNLQLADQGLRLV